MGASCRHHYYIDWGKHARAKLGPKNDTEFDDTEVDPQPPVRALTRVTVDEWQHR